MEIMKFADESENVVKYVFTKEDACYEAVLYKYPTYEERTVLCISTQCGCPVGCTFCGTGDQFIRNLSENEIIEQVFYIFDDINLRYQSVNKLQIMFMSMGEPFLNYNAVEGAICELSCIYKNADMLVSTIGPSRHDDFLTFLKMSAYNEKVGLQFSIHKAFNYERDEIIPYKNKMDLKTIRDYGVEWYAATQRKVYLNYCVDGKNNRMKDFWELSNLFPRNAFAFTFSVVCSADETMKEAGYKNIKALEGFQSYFINDGYDCRIFDPAGQDSIGGGCGQLWYVQDWMKANK